MPVPIQQSVAHYIESIHSRNGFSRERMTAADAQAFDGAMTELLATVYPDGIVRFEIVGHAVVGSS